MDWVCVWVRVCLPHRYTNRVTDCAKCAKRSARWARKTYSGHLYGEIKKEKKGGGTEHQSPVYKCRNKPNFVANIKKV